MAVPFLVCNKEERRSVILFLWAEGMQGDDIHTHIYVLSMEPMLHLRKFDMSG